MYATVEKMTEGFVAASERLSEVENDARESVLEIKKEVDSLREANRRLSKAVLGRLTTTGESETSFWPSPEMAKQFGELVLTANRKAMAEGTQAGGGALVPEELASWIIQKLGQYGVFRRDSMTVPIGSDRLQIPAVTSDLTIVCPGEGAEITPSDVAVNQVGLTTRKLCCLTKVSSELEEDSLIALGEILGTSFARSLSKREDLIGFLGDGTSTYFGMTGICGALLAVDPVIANIKSLVVGSGNTYAELTLADFRNVIAALPDDGDENAKWYMSKKFYYQVPYALAETAGVTNIFEILSDKKGRSLLGYPVEFVSCMPSTEANSQICALLGDLRLGAILGQRRDMRLDRSGDVHFTSDQIGFRGTERIAITVYGVGDTTEAGPICGLITAAS